MKNFLKNLKLNESNVSMMLGIVVVLIVGGLLVNYFRSVNNTGDISSTDTNIPSESVTVTPKLADLPAEYTVQKGDTLWMIGEKVYGSGYNWNDVYETNKEVLGNNPNVLVEGTTITLPKVEPKGLSATSSEPETPATYTVVQGDNLWNIATNVCHDGYSWVNLAQANNIATPNVIEVGQVLQVSCR